MKIEHKKKVASFIKRQSGNINVPFIGKLLKTTKDNTLFAKNIISILPKVRLFDDQIEYFHQKPAEANKRLGSFVLNTKKIDQAKENSKFLLAKLSNTTKTEQNSKKSSNIVTKTGKFDISVPTSTEKESNFVLQHQKPHTTNQNFVTSSKRSEINSNNFVLSSIKSQNQTTKFDIQTPETAFTGNFVIPRQQKIKYGMEWKLVTNPKTSKFIVNAPKQDKQRLLELAKTKKIANKIQNISKNEVMITLPAYAEGNKILDFGKSLVRSTGSVASSFIRSTGKLATNISERIDARLKSPQDAKEVGGNNGPTITVVGDKAAITGESGREKISGNSVVPQTANPEQSSQQSPQQSPQAIGASTIVDLPHLENQQNQEQQNQQEQPATQGQKSEANKQQKPSSGEMVSKGIETAVDIASTAAMLIPGIGQIAMLGKAAGFLGKVGSVGKMLGFMGKGGGKGIMNMFGAAKGKSGGALGSVKGLPGLGGLGGGEKEEGDGQGDGKGKAESGGGAGGMMGAIGSALPGAALAVPGALAVGAGAAVPALAIGAVGVGVGLAAKGLGALASGIGSLFENSPGMQIMKSILGDEEEEKKKKAAATTVAQDNRVTNTTFNNVMNQYDIYRKTADDSFMLPNYRREYG
jgi:hypothetical protein